MVQNNAESRATGGFIGSYGLITAHDGKLDVGEMLRTGIWNAAIARPRRRDATTRPTTTAAATGQFRRVDHAAEREPVARLPERGAGAESLAPQAGLTKVDGVLAVDPAGLAALLELTGPVDVPDWPTPIDSEQRRQRDAARCVRGVLATRPTAPTSSATWPRPRSTRRRRARSGSRRRSPRCWAAPRSAATSSSRSRARGAALAVELGVSGRIDPVRSDALAVTTSNFGGNKIDYYLKRAVDYRVKLDPERRATEALAQCRAPRVTLDNTAPAEGLPQIVIGPFTPGFVAGREPRVRVDLLAAADRGAARSTATAAVSPGDRTWAQRLLAPTQIPAQTSSTVDTKLAGDVVAAQRLVRRRGPPPTDLMPDRVHVSVDVPEGWRIDKAPGMGQWPAAAPRPRFARARRRRSGCISCATRVRGTCGRASRTAADPLAEHEVPALASFAAGLLGHDVAAPQGACGAGARL